LGERELLVEVVQGFDRKQDCRVIFWDFQLLVNGFEGNGEQGFTRRGNNVPLARKIMGLTFEGKLWEVEGPREHVEGKIGLLGSNIVTMIQENILYPEV